MEGAGTVLLCPACTLWWAVSLREKGVSERMPAPQSWGGCPHGPRLPTHRFNKSVKPRRPAPPLVWDSELPLLVRWPLGDLASRSRPSPPCPACPFNQDAMALGRGEPKRDCQICFVERGSSPCFWAAVRGHPRGTGLLGTRRDASSPLGCQEDHKHCG